MKRKFLVALTTVILLGCGSGAKVKSAPEETVVKTPTKNAELTKDQLNKWQGLDLVKDTIPGMSVDKAYAEIIKDKKGAEVIVAVIDAGIDINHEDLKSNIWVNTKEIPNNGIDDDKNGYVDDINGWNFLGDGYDEQLEYVRILASGNTNNPDYERAQKEYDSEYNQSINQKTQIEQIATQLKEADAAFAKYFNKPNYTNEEVLAIKTDDASLLKSVEIAKFMLGQGMPSIQEGKEELTGAVVHFNDILNVNLNKALKGRVTGDNPDDFSTKFYGNGNVKPVKEDESHGTHVAGIIAAIRNNGIGMNGVANNVKIMCIRAVPNGDEYDKDIALAIRYAADNGAKVINGSFGKYYSTHSDWVRDAIAYASKKDVVFVNAAGNENKDIDVTPVYPNDQVNNGPEVSDNFITVGSLTPNYGPKLVSSFSNYGKINVDVFAPGSDIYSTVPFSKYKSMSGTSMASPAVAGVVALVRSYYPHLNASQVKQIILDSGLPINIDVSLGGFAAYTKPFSELCKSGKIVNAYNALIMASKK